MAIAAVPDYIQKNDPEFYLSAPPGHRFLLYFPVWGENGETGKIDWRSKDRVKKFKRSKGQLMPDGWTDIENDQFACTIAACKTPVYLEETPRVRKPQKDLGLAPWKPMMKALADRQVFMANSQQGIQTFDANSTAPFTTGLGNEHPLENGFAFLNPYGLPYLPGSGVKGVLRQAARELASGEWGDDHGWSDDKVYPLIVDDKPVLDKDRHPVLLSKLDILFGRETDDGDSNHLRGALTFWDVIPQIKGDHLTVEIMTPHQGHYYRGEQTPHDSGQLIPISFLAVPPGSGFTFHVQCDTALLAQHAPELAANAGWQTLLQAAFEHAFSWLGFGAKTAVGYGAMVSEYARRKQAEREAERREAQRQAEAARLREQALANAETWTDARIKYNRANGALSVEKSGKTAVALNGQEILVSLPADLRKKVEANQFVKVTARVAGKELLNILA